MQFFSFLFFVWGGGGGIWGLKKVKEFWIYLSASPCWDRGKAKEVLVFDIFLMACPGGIPISLLTLHSLTPVGGDICIAFHEEFEP